MVGESRTENPPDGEKKKLMKIKQKKRIRDGSSVNLGGKKKENGSRPAFRTSRHFPMEYQKKGKEDNSRDGKDSATYSYMGATDRELPLTTTE